MGPITRPTLLLDEKIARQNIQAMAEKGQKNGIGVRPHFKTHVSLTIGKWFKDAGIHQCTVSSVEMATYFAEEWNDITIAFPLNRLEIEEINRLASKVTLNLVIEDTDTLSFLADQLTAKVNYFIKIDVGTNRTGLPATHDFSTLIHNSEHLTFKGFLAHAGHAYRCRSHDEIRNVYQKVSEQLAFLKSSYPDALITYGDTPTCSVIEDFQYIDELRAGNFVFYDWMQYEISSCKFDQIAVCMAVPVVAKHADRKEIVVHGGGVHFSKDQVTNSAGQGVFGAMVTLTADGWAQQKNTHYMTKASQEHGVVKVTDPNDFDQIKVGDVIGIIPTHSCLVADLMGRYFTLSGEEIHHMNWRRS